jgi:hypothetical protein
MIGRKVGVAMFLPSTPENVSCTRFNAAAQIFLFNSRFWN